MNLYIFSVRKILAVGYNMIFIEYCVCVLVHIFSLKGHDTIKNVKKYKKVITQPNTKSSLKVVFKTVVYETYFYS